MAGPPFLFGSFLRSALSFKCLFAKESGVWKVHRLAVDLWTLQNTQICHVDLFLQSHPVHNFIMLEIESADVHLLKSEPCQPAQKNRECNTPQERFPRLWNYLGWPAAVTACHSPVSWMALSTPTCGGQGFLYADHRCGRSFTAFKMVVIASLRSLGISSPNQNTEIPRDQLDDVKKTHV